MIKDTFPLGKHGLWFSLAVGPWNTQQIRVCVKACIRIPLVTQGSLLGAPFCAWIGPRHARWSQLMATPHHALLGPADGAGLCSCCHRTAICVWHFPFLWGCWLESELPSTPAGSTLLPQGLERVCPCLRRGRRVVLRAQEARGASAWSHARPLSRAQPSTFCMFKCYSYFLLCNFYVFVSFAHF